MSELDRYYSELVEVEVDGHVFKVSLYTDCQGDAHEVISVDGDPDYEPLEAALYELGLSESEVVERALDIVTEG